MSGLGYVMMVTVWAWRKSEETPELVVAWDELDVDLNPAGFQEERARALDAMKDDLYAWREVRVKISYDDILAAFGTTTVEGTVAS